MDAEITKEQIKEEVEIQYENIKNARESIKLLRERCKHTVTHEGLYSWRVGSEYPATICSHCGELIKLHMGETPKSQPIVIEPDDLPPSVGGGYGFKDILGC